MMYSLLFLLILSLTSITNRPNNKDRKPNVIVIFTDDQGYQDVGCFGSPDIETPNLDKMAREGIKLINFYEAQVVCSASRAGLLTGCYPNRIGIHGAFFLNSKKGLNVSETTIADMLKDIGYKTALFGKWHLADQHPDVVAKINLLATKKRLELGDDLQKQKGKENRPIGEVN